MSPSGQPPEPSPPQDLPAPEPPGPTFVPQPLAEHARDEGQKAPPSTWPAMPEDPGGSPTLLKQEEVAVGWPTMPEDPVQDRSEGEGACPCFIRVRFIRVGGASTSYILQALASLLIDNPEGRDLYHAALEVQVPESNGCNRYVIEMQDFIDDPREARSKGQVAQGDVGAFGAASGALIAATWGPSYGIRRWRNGQIKDGDDPEVAHAGRLIVSRDCDKARRLLELVPKVPTNPYSSKWTSNSVISWLLEKAGCNPGTIQPPVHGLTPNWSQGIKVAQGQ